MGRKPFKRILVVLGCLALVGHLRLNYEARVAEQMRAERLLEPQLDQSAREKLGQRGAFIALGGLRSLVATWRSFVAMEHFTEAEWVELESEYELITTLAPHNEYHWATGAWHLAYNASGYFERQQGMHPVQQKSLVRAYVRKGKDFFRDGIRLNPDSWELKARLGTLCADPDRYPDYAEASRWLKEASRTEGALPFYARAAAYAKARQPGQAREALAELLELWQNPDHRLPTVRVLIFVLQEKLALPPEKRLSMEELFGSPGRAYTDLVNYQTKDSSYPRHGVREAILALEKSMDIPFEKSRALPEW